MAKKRTSKQRAASRRNLEIARRVKASRGKKGAKKAFKSAYKAQRSFGMPKKIARNVAWGQLRHG
jgi:hypothetical protein